MEKLWKQEYEEFTKTELFKDFKKIGLCNKFVPVPDMIIAVKANYASAGIIKLAENTKSHSFEFTIKGAFFWNIYLNDNPSTEKEKEKEKFQRAIVGKLFRDTK